MPKKPHTHYVVDCFVTDTTEVGGLRKISFSIAAYNDNEAISEARLGSVMYSPHYFHVRAVTRQGDRVFYKSEDDA